MTCKKLILPLIILTSFLYSFTNNGTKTIKEPAFLHADTAWVDSVFDTLTADERIAQLFMVAAFANRDSAHIKEITNLVQNYKIGGLIFMKGTPYKQANLTNYYQSLAKTPLLIAMDAEWGLSMRMDSTTRFPRQMTLGAIQNDSLIYAMGVEMARQCKRIGVQVSFSPVIDINNNPKNPVINNRSFGEDKYNVTRKGIMYMNGLQDNHIIACGKHFPGHGDTDKDSHHTLPIITYDRSRLDTLELFPFKELFNEGLASVMVAHIFMPTFESDPKTATTLSKKVVTDLLKGELGFKGLVFTDALNMKGVSSFNKPGDVDLKALLAGNDVLLFSENVPLAINEINKAIEKGLITRAEVDSRCKKILMAKYWTGLNNLKPINLQKLTKELNDCKADIINRKLAEASITVIKNDSSFLPLHNIAKKKIATLTIGDRNRTVFQNTVESYTIVDHFNIDSNFTATDAVKMIEKLQNYDLIIASIVNTSNKPEKNFGVSEFGVSMLNIVGKTSPVVMAMCGNAFSMPVFGKCDRLKGVLVAYEDSPLAQEYAAQLIFGAFPAKGKLPVTASQYFPRYYGLTTKTSDQFKFTYPTDAGFYADSLVKIDSIVLNGIKAKAFPGCQVLVVKDKKVVYQKSFGYQTYDNKQAVQNTDIYDLASITKVAASTLAVMKLVDENKLSLDDKLDEYLHYLHHTNKNDIRIRELMAHQARLKPFIPFYMQTLAKDGSYKPNIFSTTPTEKTSNHVANNLYILNSYRDTIFKAITHSELLDDTKYKYSDMGYYYIMDIVEHLSGKTLDQYMNDNFYSPMGLSTMGYKPLDRFEIKRIAPTELDATFRKQLIQGYVHDPGAAMLGGVGGHAGLFSNALDLAKLMQMLLNGGDYNGNHYIKPETINEFTRCQYPKNHNRRAVGFDKPGAVIGAKETPTAIEASNHTFGHTGFTGTCVWVDPDYNLIYVFLSNRVNPSADNNKLVDLNIRTRIQKVIYDAIKK